MLVCENEHILHSCASILLDLETVYCIFYFMLFGHICKPVVDRPEDTYILIKKYRSSTTKVCISLEKLYVCMHAPSCPSLCDPMNWSQPDSTVHGIFQASKHTGVSCYFLLQRIFPTQGLSRHLLCILHWEANFCHCAI